MIKEIRKVLCKLPCFSTYPLQEGLKVLSLGVVVFVVVVVISSLPLAAVGAIAALPLSLQRKNSFYFTTHNGSLLLLLALAHSLSLSLPNSQAAQLKRLLYIVVFVAVFVVGCLHSLRQIKELFFFSSSSSSFFFFVFNLNRVKCYDLCKLRALPMHATQGHMFTVPNCQ